MTKLQQITLVGILLLASSSGCILPIEMSDRLPDWMFHKVISGDPVRREAAPSDEKPPAPPEPATFEVPSGVGPKYKRPVIVGGATGTSDTARDIEKRLGIE